MNRADANTKTDFNEKRIDTERKLELVRAVRMQSQYNRNQCRERERLLYGTPSVRGEIYASEDSLSLPQPRAGISSAEAPVENSSFLGGFRLRLLLAMLLFGLFIYTDVKEITVFGKNTDAIWSLCCTSMEFPDAFRELLQN